MKVESPKRLKERFLIRRNRTKRANFRGSPLFQATYNNTTENSSRILLFLTYSINCVILLRSRPFLF